MTIRVTLDDVQAQIRDLSRLLMVIRDESYELDYGNKGDNTKKHMLDRIQSLLSIACDTAERTADQIDENYHEIRKPPLMVPGVPAEILELGCEVLALYERFNRRRQELEASA